MLVSSNLEALGLPPDAEDTWLEVLRMLFDSLEVVGAALARFVVELLPENFSVVVGVIDEEIVFHISAGK
jgi:hypothetical protein